MCDRWPRRETDPRTLWKAHSASILRRPAMGGSTLPIGLAGTFTVDPLVPYLGGELLARGIPNPSFSMGPFNQVHQLCLSPDTFFEFQPRIILLLIRTEDVVSDMTDFKNAAGEVDNLLQSLESLRKKFGGILIVSTLPYPLAPSFDVHDLQQPVSGGALFHAMQRRWVQGLAQIGGIQILNLDGLLMQMGMEAALDIRKWYLYKQPYSEGFWARVGALAARILAAQTQPGKKCVVVDCDNTLWGGVIGEEGLSGIELGSDFPGSAFRDFQSFLLFLRSKGVLLAVASKNNEADVFEVFDTHDAMVLKRDHISAFEVHWNSKVESLRKIAEKHNIGTDSLVFIDDSQKEVAEVRERLPEVVCLVAPEDPAELPGLLSNTGLFDSPGVTEEDGSRAAMIREEGRRTEARASLSEEDFLKGLGLEIKVFEVQGAHLARVTQLINKTNQFNLTTIRRSADEVRSMSASKNSCVFAMDVKDRFGAYGIVGVAIATRQEGGAWFMDTLLMSCRVLGRGAERTFLAKIAEGIKRRGGKRLIGEYRSTPKNALVKDFYKNFGFRRDEERWICDVEVVPQPPEYSSCKFGNEIVRLKSRDVPRFQRDHLFHRSPRFVVVSRSSPLFCSARRIAPRGPGILRPISALFYRSPAGPGLPGLLV